MAIKKFNAVAGFSVGGDVVFEVIDNVANVNANNLSVTGTSQLGSNANVKITGGSSGQVLKTDGAGNLSWATDTASPAGSNTQIQYNGSGSFAASANLTYNDSSKTLTVDNVTANGAGITYITGANVAGQVANALIAGTVYTAAQPNITSVGTLTGLTSTGVINLTGASNVSLGPVGNVRITGGSAGQVLKTDGLGNLSWSADTTDYSNANVTSLLASFGSNTITTTGNITAGNIIGNGQSLTGLNGSNVTGQVSNALVAGTVYTAAQPNITSVGTLSNLNVSGNITSGNANLGNLASANFVSGTLTTASQPNITSVGTLSSLTSTGTVNLTNASNVSLGPIGNVRITGGSAGYVLKTDGAGNLSWAADVTDYSNSNVTSLLASFGSNTITTTGNVTVGNIIGNGQALTGLNGANVTGQVSNALVAGTVYTNAQPNITSVGTLSGVTSTGVVNFTSSSNVALGPVGNVHITGGSSGYALITDGTGNLSWGPAGGTSGGFVNIVKNTLTGNGSQTTFTLTTTPSGLDAVSVNINGITQFSNTYSVSSNQITFSTAPLSGSIIEVTVYGVIPAITSSQIPYSNGSYYVGSAAFTFNDTTNVLSVTNITSTGTLNLSTASNVTLGAVGNVHISGGAAGQYLQTDGSGNLSWETINTSAVANGTSNVSIPVANGNVNLSAGGNANILVVTSTGANVTTGSLNLGSGLIAVTGTDAGIFTSVIGNVNIGLSANVTVGSTTGDITLRGNTTVGNLTSSGTATITNLKVNDFYSNRTPVVVTTSTVIDSFPINKYRSAKYTIRANSDDGYQAIEVLLIHDGSASYVTVYGSLSTIGSDIVYLSTDITSGNVRLLATTTSTNTTINLLGTYVTG
jgi:hypothetical protein